MGSHLRPALAIALVIFVRASSQGATFTEDFNDGALDPQVQVQATGLGGGPTYNFASSRLNIGGMGDIRFVPDFLVSGDFVASVDTRNINGHFLLGAYDQNNNSITHNIISEIFGGWSHFAEAGTDASLQSPLSSGLASFRLRRVGTTLYADADLGSGLQNYASDTNPAYADPLSIRLVAGTVGIVGWFDNWSITAEAFVPVPEPATAMLAIVGCLALAIQRRRHISTLRPM